MKPANQFPGKSFLMLLLFAFNPVGLLAGETESSTKHFDLVISKRQVVLEDKTIRVTQGDSIEMSWVSDEAGELHVHGYDISFKVSPAKPAVINFQAHATGRFPVTSHGFGGDHGHGHEALLYLEVHPQ